MLKLKYKVLKELSEEGIKQLFINHWYGLHKKYLIICLIIGFAWLITSSIIFEDDTTGIIAMLIPAILVPCYWLYYPIRLANKWWMNIKNNEQPIDIDKVL
jgi:hypothetical protein